MDAVNLSALLRTQQPGSDSSEYTTTSGSPTGDDPIPSSGSAIGGGTDGKPDAAKEKSKLSGQRTFTGGDVVELFKSKKKRNRIPLGGHNDPTNDTLPLRSYWIGLFTPTVYMAIFYALRITFLVALPLGILARHPNVMNVFPAHVVIPLWGIVDCRYTFGEQFAFNIVSIQCGIMMMMWGTLNNVWNIHDHPAGWWCSVFFCAFFLSLFGDVRARRVVVLQCVLILQMESLPGGTTLIYPVKVGRDMIMATGFAFFQCLFPVRSIAKDCDEMMAGGWKHIGLIARNCVTACWSDDPIECAIALGHISTEPIQKLFINLPGKLFFVMYEFWESTLRLELRRERLSVMEMCMPRLHTMTDTARAMVVKRVHSAQVEPHPTDGSQAHKATSGADPHSPYADGEGAGQATRGGGVQFDLQSREPYGDMADKDSCGAVADMQRRQRRETERVEYLKEVSDQEKQAAKKNVNSKPPPRTSSVLVMQFQSLLWKRAGEILHDPVNRYLDALDAVLEGLGKHLNPHETAQKVPFADLREAATELQSKLDEVHFETLIKSETPVDPFLYSNVFAFHLSLVVLAQRFLEYGERMENFDRSRYKSQLRRAWEFFFYDYWKGFWEELPKRLTLATPRDVRIFKDAIKMACAYTVGAMYTEHMDPENIYYFGMAILMGVGWPTAGDTMEASVYRVTGMVCACSIAYVAIWHTPNLAAELAIALAGVFLSLLFRDRPPYAHTAQYCSMLVITALNSAGTKLVLLSRIVSNCFTVMTYYAIVVFIFPIDVLRVTYNAQVKAITTVADRFSRLVDVISQPLCPDDPAKYTAMRTEVFNIRGSRVPMWQAVTAVGTWLPKAAADPAPLGNPYPLQAMRDMYSSLRRLGSATDVICASLSGLLKDETPQRRPDVEHILAAVAPVMQMVDETSRVLFQDFLDALSKPYEWSPTLTTYHFSVFLSLSRALHHACWTAHRRNVKALRANFRNKVMNRTFAAAARSQVVDPQTLEQARNLSFAVQPSDVYTPTPVARREEPENDEDDESVPSAGGRTSLPTPHSPTSNSNGGPAVTAEAAADAQDAFDPVDVPPPISGRTHSQSSTAHNASMVSGTASVPPQAEDGVPPVTNGSIARTIAESVAMVRSTERRNSRLVRRDVPGRGPLSNVSFPTSASSGVAGAYGGTSPALQPSGNTLPVATGGVVGGGGQDDVANADEVAEQHQLVKEQAAFEKVLDPYERQAQEEERRAFIARRSLEHSHQERSTLSNDVNLVMTIMVGTDMFFGEAERMLKTMYTINEYARSRLPPPKPKDDDSKKYFFSPVV